MIQFFWTILICFSSGAFANEPQYINLKKQFQSFTQKAQGQNLEKQIEIWKSEVESSIPRIYAEMFSANPDFTVDQYRKRLAAAWFPFLIKHSDKIAVQFDVFDQKAWPAVQRLAKNNPEVDFSDVKLIAMPSLMMFNGMVNDIDGKYVALFGMDFLQLVEEEPQRIEGSDLFNNVPVLVAHEFSHVLYAKLLESKGVNDGALGLLGPLWNEGLAQMNSQLLVPGTEQYQIFMEHNLAKKCTAAQASAWAKMYLADAEQMNPENSRALYSKWFYTNFWKELGVPRAGYCVGFNVVLGAMRFHSFNDLIRMAPEESKDVILRSIRQLAGF